MSKNLINKKNRQKHIFSFIENQNRNVEKQKYFRLYSLIKLNHIIIEEKEKTTI